MNREERSLIRKNGFQKTVVIGVLLVAVILLTFICLFVGSSHMSVSDSFAALIGKGTETQARIIWNIRVPACWPPSSQERGCRFPV